MKRMEINFIGICKLNHLSEVHNCYSVTDMSYDQKVMSNKQICKSKFILKFIKHIYNLCLD